MHAVSIAGVVAWPAITEFLFATHANEGLKVTDDSAGVWGPALGSFQQTAYCFY